MKTTLKSLARLCLALPVLAGAATGEVRATELNGSQRATFDEPVPAKDFPVLEARLVTPQSLLTVEPIVVFCPFSARSGESLEELVPNVRGRWTLYDDTADLEAGTFERRELDRGKFQSNEMGRIELLFDVGAALEGGEASGEPEDLLRMLTLSVRLTNSTELRYLEPFCIYRFPPS